MLQSNGGTQMLTAARLSLMTLLDNFRRNAYALQILLLSLVCGAWPLAQARALPAVRPQLIWQGTVQGTHDLLVHKDLVMVEDVSGPPVTGIAYRFTIPIPKEDLKVNLDPLTTRGYVHVLQEPKMENDYVLKIRIEDRQDGPAPYVLAVSWKADGPEVAVAKLSETRKPVRPHDAAWAADGKRSNATWRASWTGMVDGSARIAITQSTASVLEGQASGHLDLVEGTVWPKKTYHPLVMVLSSETQAKIVVEPTSKNEFTTVLEVHAKSSLVSLEIAW